MFSAPARRDALRGSTVSHGSLWFFLAVLWGQLFVVLAPSWQGATYYDYGWLVGPFALLFAWRRWQEESPEAVTVPRAAWSWALAAGAVALLVPVRVVEHVDVYWRLALWVHAALVFGTTHLVLALVFGARASTSVLPATLFALLAVPLPSFVELQLVQGLTRQVVQLASGMLPLAGYPVDVAGNSLVVKGELLDVAEGCSGIRSFQSSAMAGLCLGELLRLGGARRIALVAASLALAIVWNAGRVFMLARLAYDEGRAASEAAHDALGVWVLLLTYGGISLCAWLLTFRRGDRRRVVRTVDGAHDQRGKPRGPRTRPATAQRSGDGSPAPGTKNLT